MKLTGVIFDLDGTIAESHPMAFQLIGGAIADHGGGSLTPEEVMALFGPNEQGIFQRALGDRWEPAWAQYVEDYERHHDICPEPFPGVRALLERLRACGTRLGLVTGKTETTVRISLEVFGITELFDGVHGGSVNGSVKEAAIADLLEA